MSSPTVLIVPGYTNSGPEHWQSVWQRKHPGYRRVEQADWDNPDVATWVAELDREIAAAEEPVVLVAHSLGCSTIGHWAARHPESASRVAAAFLVAPPDIERPSAPDVLRAFGPVPLVPLRFPSVVVASTNDPHAPIARARDFAAGWGAHFIDVGEAGHINTAAGFGDWPDGERMFAELLSTAIPEAARRSRTSQ